jgi:UDP-3-O-[3-hydroxymyristoyl] N-acetylglucosamine deacetylase
LQHTVKSSVTFDGTGLHSGQPVRMVLHPAAPDSGIRFIRTDIRDLDPVVPARWDVVVPSALCTLVANEDGVSVSTIEHIMAALAGLAIWNVEIHIDGPEVPIMDGSAAPFVAGIMAKGITALNAPSRTLRVLRAVEVRQGEAWARLEPASMLEIDFRIDFAEPAIGTQSRALNMANGAFVRELCDSRTFCRQADVDAMRAQGLALGGTLDNAVVFDGAQILSPGGLRHADEPVRHKMLDALGDLALAGAPLMARYTGNRAGHAMTNRLLRALFAEGAVELDDCDAFVTGKLPGIGVHAGDLHWMA